MCGIFGIVLNNNNENIYNLIIDGLIQLQNRGYDSAGICVIKNNKFEVNKCASTNKLNALDKLMSITDIKESKDDTYIGIGHNRWATHGVKNDTNAHPHLSSDSKFVIVHNGIIENYNEIKQKLIKEGFIFNSQTDTEVIVNLLQYNYNNSVEDTNMTDIIKQTIEELRGTYGLLIQSLYEPNKLYCVRNGSPLLIGQNDEEVIVTSEQSGFCNKMSNYITLHNDDICVITRNNENVSINTTHNYIKKNVTLVESNQTPHPYKHWTLKEINEQPDVILNSINKGGRIKNASEVKLGGLEQHDDSLKNIDNIIILGCGTSYFAGLYGMYFLNNYVNLIQFRFLMVRSLMNRIFP